MRRNHLGGHRLFVVCLTVLFGCSTTGCVGMTAQLMYALGQHEVPAEFAGLKGQRVAVVCVANTANYDPGSAASMLAQTVSSILRLKVDKIDIISQDKVNDWIDNKNWNQMDYRDVGRGVNAQKVVAIDLDSYRLHEDQTLFKGHANITVTVYDMTKSGEAVFRKSMANFTFPSNTHEPAINTTEQEFQRKFVFAIANDISKRFYSHEPTDDFAPDATILHR